MRALSSPALLRNLGTNGPLFFLERGHLSQCTTVHTHSLQRSPQDAQSILSPFRKVCLVLKWAEKRQILCLGETWGLKPLSNNGQHNGAEKLRSPLI